MNDVKEISEENEKVESNSDLNRNSNEIISNSDRNK